MKTSYVFLANGFEEVEALTQVDVFRRGVVDIKTVSITDNKEVTSSHGVTVVADITIKEVNANDADWLILPGGMPGATNLYSCEALKDLLFAHDKKGGRIAAICASPAVVLGQMGMLEGREATCYPGFEDKCKGAKMIDRRCVTCGNLVTANGPSSSINMAYEILKQTIGVAEANKVMNGMLLYPKQENFFF